VCKCVSACESVCAWGGGEKPSLCSHPLTIFYFQCVKTKCQLKDVILSARFSCGPYNSYICGLYFYGFSLITFTAVNWKTV